MQIIAARASIDELQRQPRSEAEVRAALLVVVKAAVYRNAPESVFELYTTGEAPEFDAMDRLSLSAFVAHQAYLMGEEALVDRYMALLKAAGRFGNVSSKERDARLAKLRTRVRELEIAEERSILEIERVGHVILRRPDADPEVLFEVWSETRTSKEAA